MPPKTEHSAKFAFLYMLSLVALVFTSVAIGQMIFQLINKYIPDYIGRFGEYFSSDILRFAIAALLVAAPLFFVSSYLLNKNLFDGSLDKNAGVRKWFVYFIMLVSSLVVFGWFIALIVNYLNGELTLKFALKFLTIIFISAVPFSFYLYDIRREKVAGHKDGVIKAYFICSLVVVLAALVTALIIVESPKHARDRKLDNVVMEDFDTIYNGLDNYYTANQRLPFDLNELKAAETFVTDDNLKDPETGEPYEYFVIGDNKFQLCATFRISNLDNGESTDTYYRETWPHKGGRQCVDKMIEKIPAGKLIY